MLRLNAEQEVLAAPMLNPAIAMSMIHRVGLKPEHFTSEAHRAIANAIFDLHLRDAEITFETVGDELNRTGEIRLLKSVGGAFYLVELVDNLVTSESCAYFARKVIERAELETELRAHVRRVSEISEQLEAVSA